MKFAWILALVAGLAVLVGGMTVHGAIGAFLMFVGMLLMFSAIALFVLGEYKASSNETIGKHA